MKFTTPNITIPIPPGSRRSDDLSLSPQMPSFSFRSINLKRRHPTSLVSSEASAEDHPIFMSSKPVIKKHRSFLPSSDQVLKGKSLIEPDTKCHDELARENMAWDIINKEISEWQTVCQTGRPSWWSPVSKWTRNQVGSTWQEEIHSISPWSLNSDDAQRPKQRYDERRRAVTDSYLADNNNVQDLAQLIAIQLLSACFTLPPEQMTSYKSSAYHCFDTLDPKDIANSRLISSLRMHTEVRYSPSFGHQARNTSPEYHGQGLYDVSSRSRSMVRSSDGHSSNIAGSSTMPRRRRIHRALHVTEGSAAECLMDSHSGWYDVSNLSPPAEAAIRHRGERVNEPLHKIKLPKLPDRVIHSCPSSPREFDYSLLRSSSLNSKIFGARSKNAPYGSRSPLLYQQTNRQTFQPVIRSEPHHVYIQPVRELIAKRWQSLRRRFGQRHTQEVTNSGESGKPFTPSASVFSIPGERNLESPFLSSEGRERRRKARESSNTHSSSGESHPRYNTPTLADCGGTTSPALVEEASTNLRGAEDLFEQEAASTTGLGGSLNLGMSNIPSTSLRVTDGQILLDVSSGSAILDNGRTLRTESELSKEIITSNFRPPQSAHFQSKRQQTHPRKQKSMLSEVCTPEDIEDVRNALNEIGSLVQNPMRESSFKLVGGQQNWIPSFDKETIVSRSLPEASLENDEVPKKERMLGTSRMPRIVRTSTSGTQVFTPSQDGVEVDGLPVGLAFETLDDDVEENLMTERSFL